MKIKIKKSQLVITPLAIISAILLILFIGAFAKKDAFSSYNLWGAKQTIVESQNIDTDNDGLKDWEEDLYKTDRLNPDTDGDGYLDGEEIDAGTNPLVKAPNDKQWFNPLPLGDRYNITKKLLNSDVINSILDSYVAQKNSYINDHGIASPDEFTQTANKSTVQEMFTRAIADAYPALIQNANNITQEMPEMFDIAITDKDVKISEDNSQENIKNYIKNVSSLLKSNTFFLQQQSLTAITSAFKDGDFSKIDTIIKNNEDKLNIAKDITVPSSWKEIHEEGLRLVFTLRNIFVCLRDLPNDPLKAYVAVNRLEGFSGAWNKLMEETIDLAKTQKIEINL